MSATPKDFQEHDHKYLSEIAHELKDKINDKACDLNLLNEVKLHDDLHKAIASDDLDGVKKAITQGAKIDLYCIMYRTPSGIQFVNCEKTALQRASELGHVRIMQYLLTECKADPNFIQPKQHKRFAKPLALAAFNGHRDAVACLLRAGANFAALDQFTTYSNEIRQHPQNLLQIAASRGLTNAVALLLENGYQLKDYTHPSSLGVTALFYAVRYGHFDTFLFLFNKDKTQMTFPSSRSNINTPLSIIAWSLSDYQDPNLLVHSLGNSYTPHSLPPNIRAQNENIYINQIKIARFLFAEGVYIDADKYFQDLCREMYVGNLYVRYNERHQKKKDPLNKYEQQLLGLFEATVKLLEISRSKEGSGFNTWINVLGEALNGRCLMDGNTALHNAVKYDNVPLIEALLDNNADKHIANDKKEGEMTPYQLAQTGNNPYVRGLLELSNLKQKLKKDSKENEQLLLKTSAQVRERIFELAKTLNKEDKEKLCIRLAIFYLTPSLVQNFPFAFQVLGEVEAYKGKLFNEVMLSIAEHIKGDDKFAFAVSISTLLTQPDLTFQGARCYNPIGVYKLLIQVPSRMKNEFLQANNMIYQLLLQGLVVSDRSCKQNDKKELASKDSTLVSKNSTLESKDSTLASKNSALASKDSALESKYSETERKSAELDLWFEQDPLKLNKMIEANNPLQQCILKHKIKHLGFSHLTKTEPGLFSKFVCHYMFGPEATVSGKNFVGIPGVDGLDVRSMCFLARSVVRDLQKQNFNLNCNLNVRLNLNQNTTLLSKKFDNSVLPKCLRGMLPIEYNDERFRNARNLLRYLYGDHAPQLFVPNLDKCVDAIEGIDDLPHDAFHIGIIFYILNANQNKVFMPIQRMLCETFDLVVGESPIFRIRYGLLPHFQPDIFVEVMEEFKNILEANRIKNEVIQFLDSSDVVKIVPFENVFELINNGHEAILSELIEYMDSFFRTLSKKTCFTESDRQRYNFIVELFVAICDRDIFSNDNISSTIKEKLLNFIDDNVKLIDMLWQSKKAAQILVKENMLPTAYFLISNLSEPCVKNFLKNALPLLPQSEKSLLIKDTFEDENFDPNIKNQFIGYLFDPLNSLDQNEASLKTECTNLTASKPN